MDNSLILSALLLLIFSLPCTFSQAQYPDVEVEKWVETLTHKPEKLTKLHFYFHRNSKSGVAVARANTTYPTGFGTVVIKDDPLTLGPEPSSSHIGYAQGMSATTSMDDVVLIESFAFVFTDGAHNGSTLAILGSNAILHEYREMPIVGGSGVFRLARGVVSYRTVFYNSTSFDASVEVNVVAFHF